MNREVVHYLRNNRDELTLQPSQLRSSQDFDATLRRKTSAHVTGDRNEHRVVKEESARIKVELKEAVQTPSHNELTAEKFEDGPVSMSLTAPDYWTDSEDDAQMESLIEERPQDTLPRRRHQNLFAPTLQCSSRHHILWQN